MFKFYPEYKNSKLKNQKMELEIEKLKSEKNPNQIWIAADPKELISILKEINYLKITDERESERRLRSTGYKRSLLFDIKLTKEQLQKIEKEKENTKRFKKFLYPLNDNIVCLNIKLDAPFFYELIDDFLTIQKKYNRKLIFIYPSPETLFQPKEKPTPKKVESNIVARFSRQLPNYLAIYKKQQLYLSNILNMTDKFNKDCFRFIQKDLGLEFIIIGEKIAIRENSEGEWVFFKNISELDSIYSKYEPVINEIINEKNTISFSQINLSKLWEIARKYYFCQEPS